MKKQNGKNSELYLQKIPKSNRNDYLSYLTNWWLAISVAKIGRDWTLQLQKSSSQDNSSGSTEIFLSNI